MIVVTGGAGFIGSVLVWRLNQLGYDEIVIVDHLDVGEKWKNLVGLNYQDLYHKEDFFELIIDERLPFNIDTIFHLGACSSTTERDADYLVDNNFKYSVELVRYCLPRGTHFIYASSAATYGDGSVGYCDDESKLKDLRPLNMYGYSKHMFDRWLQYENLLSKVVGLKYFNVFGPNEYHKDEMRSVVHKAFEQVKETGKVKLFKSYNDQYADGEQRRDFVYVKDAVDMTIHFLTNPEKAGIYNVGGGKSRTWNDLVTALFNAMDKPVNIEYVEMPEELKGKYQYFTEADTSKIKSAGYDKKSYSLEEGIEDYVKNYLMKNEFVGW